MSRTQLVSGFTTAAYIVAFLVLPIFQAPQPAVAACDDSGLKSAATSIEQSITLLQSKIQAIANASSQSAQEVALVQGAPDVSTADRSATDKLNALRDDLTNAASAGCETEFNTYNTNLSTYVQQFNGQISSYNELVNKAKQAGLTNSPATLEPYQNPGLVYSTLNGSANAATCEKLLSQLNSQVSKAQDAIIGVQSLIAGKSSLDNAGESQFMTFSDDYTAAFKAAADTENQADATPGCSSKTEFQNLKNNILSLVTQSQSVSAAASAIGQSWQSVAAKTADNIAQNIAGDCGCGGLDVNNSGGAVTKYFANPVQTIFNRSVCITICTISAALGTVACYIIAYFIDPVFGSPNAQTCNPNTAGGTPVTPSPAASGGGGSGVSPSTSSTPSPAVDPNGGGVDLTPAPGAPAPTQAA